MWDDLTVRNIVGDLCQRHAAKKRLSEQQRCRCNAATSSPTSSDGDLQDVDHEHRAIEVRNAIAQAGNVLNNSVRLEVLIARCRCIAPAGMSDERLRATIAFFMNDEEERLIDAVLQ